MASTITYFDENTPDLIIQSLFDKYDFDKSGTLTMDELPSLLKDLGFGEEAADTYSLLIDKDGSGEVTFEEFKAWLKKGNKITNNQSDCSRFCIMERAVEMFRKYDQDSNGTLDHDEFKELHVDLGGNPCYVEYALRCLDLDNNGKISFYEFLKWLNWVDLGNY